MTGGKSARFRDEDMADTYLNKAIDFVSRNKSKPFFYVLLFGLSNDPSESSDLAAKNPAKVAELRKIIQNVAPEKVTGEQGLNKK